MLALINFSSQVYQNKIRNLLEDKDSLVQPPLINFSKGAYFFYVDTEGGGGVRKMPILLNKMSTKGGRGGGQKSLKSCLRSKSMTPYCEITNNTISDLMRLSKIQISFNLIRVI